VVSLGVNVVAVAVLEGEGGYTVADSVVEDTGGGSSLLSTGTPLSVLVDTASLDNVGSTFGGRGDQTRVYNRGAELGVTQRVGGAPRQWPPAPKKLPAAGGCSALLHNHKSEYCLHKVSCWRQLCSVHKPNKCAPSAAASIGKAGTG